MCVDPCSLVVAQCSDLLYKVHGSHSYEMVCGYKFFIGAPRQGHRRTRGGNVPSWRTLEGKLSNPRGCAARARCMNFSRKFTKSRARAPRGAPCASFLPLNSTVGGPWGPNEGRGGLAGGTHVVHQYGRGTLLRVCVGPVRPVGGLYRGFL